MPMHYLETGSLDPCYNLALEQFVLEYRTEGDWLMLWQNANTIVIGQNQNTAEEIDPAFVAAHGITVVRRMTGGGAVYHDLGNLNYSFITDVGNAEELSIRRFTEPVCRALAAMGVEAETSGRNDIVVDGRKVSGVAQRIAGGRILHHGTLLFDSDPAMIAGSLRADPAKFRSKSAKSVRSRVGMLRDYLPAGTDLCTFWDRILQEKPDRTGTRAGPPPCRRKVPQLGLDLGSQPGLPGAAARALSGRHAGSAYERAPRRNHRHRILRRLYGDRIAACPDRRPAWR